MKDKTKTEIERTKKTSKYRKTKGFDRNKKEKGKKKEKKKALKITTKLLSLSHHLSSKGGIGLTNFSPFTSHCLSLK
jgi:hypothetical protein